MLDRNHQFKLIIENSDCCVDRVEFTIDGQATVSDMVEAFKRYLTAAGYPPEIVQTHLEAYDEN